MYKIYLNLFLIKYYPWTDRCNVSEEKVSLCIGKYNTQLEIVLTFMDVKI